MRWRGANSHSRHGRKSNVLRCGWRGDEFAHEGGKGGCFGFAGCAEAFIERFEDGVAAGGDGGGRAQEKEDADGQEGGVRRLKAVRANCMD